MSPADIIGPMPQPPSNDPSLTHQPSAFCGSFRVGTKAATATPPAPSNKTATPVLLPLGMDAVV